MRDLRVLTFLATALLGSGCTGGFVRDASTQLGVNGAAVEYQDWPGTNFAGPAAVMTTHTSSIAFQPGGTVFQSAGLYTNLPDEGVPGVPFLADGWYRVVVDAPSPFMNLGAAYYVDHRRDDECPYKDEDNVLLASDVCERQDFVVHPTATTAVYDLEPDLIVDVRGMEGLYESNPAAFAPFTQCVTIDNGPVIAKVLRASTSIANVGAGPLHLVGEDNGQTTQQVYRRNAAPQSVPVGGEFNPHPSHGHIHFDDYAHMRLVSKTGGCNYWLDRAESCIVSAGEKISFCVMESDPFVESVVDFFEGPPGSTGTWGLNFTNGNSVCHSNEQGLRPGWTDTYSTRLPGQWVDVEDVPPGDYWLEAEVDPDGQLVERTRDNNIARYPVTIDGSCDQVLNCNSGTMYSDQHECLDFVPG
ncbi:MAG: lysyl oxidase family protein [Myxococcota bacterium]